jgi:hypothetical protein
MDLADRLAESLTCAANLKDEMTTKTRDANEKIRTLVSTVPR